jgi:hypothetical protein
MNYEKCIVRLMKIMKRKVLFEFEGEARVSCKLKVMHVVYFGLTLTLTLTL